MIMGCSDGTCALTRTGISFGQEVLVVAFRSDLVVEDLIDGSYRLLQLFDQQGGAIFRHVGVGSYDDYGNVGEFDSSVDINGSDLWWRYQLLVHRFAAERFLGETLVTGVDLQLQAIRLMRKAKQARISLAPGFPTGDQFVSQEELSLQRELLCLAEEAINRNLQYIAAS